MIVDPLELPEFLRVDTAEQERRRLARRGLRLRWTREMSFDDPAGRPDKDLGTVRLLDERRAQERADAKAEQARRKEDRLIRERQKVNPPGHEPTEQETAMKNATSKKDRAAKHGARKGAKKAMKARKTDRRQKKSAPRKLRAGTVNISTVLKTGKLTAKANLAAQDKINVVQQTADMMARPAGHKDAPLGGASMDEMVKATGYDAHQMRAKIKLVRDRLKYITTAPSKANGYRYFAVPQKAEG